ncbi:MAG: cyclic nucleotide-binding domain-containing protein [Gemmatimonadota bacterium]|nr:MAG: cyclic nucleotide-binding domain-containing protein [Gemmatimonadota bacterium]
MLTTVERVIFLQEIDIFEYTSTEDLAHIAAITDEIEIGPDQVIYREGDPPDAMYIVIEGRVSLTREGQGVIENAKHKDYFGTWALFDDELRKFTAVTLEQSRLLKIEKEDFIDLIADHVQITQGILKAMAKRQRRLIEIVAKRYPQKT